MRPELFNNALSREETVKLFKEYVELVEVETCSFCNRRCLFCPNTYLDRYTQKKYMSASVWDKIISPLSDIGYGGTFAWTRYSEPLADPGIIIKIREARKALPQSPLVSYSNSDYLTSEYLKELSESGLTHLVVNIYLPEDISYSVAIAIERCRALAQRIKCDLKIVESNKFRTLGFSKYAKMRISIGCTNFNVKSSVQDRGGIMKEFSPAHFCRISPCFQPFKSIYIDWDGSVMPCCQMRSDAPEHKDCIVGRIQDGLSDMIDAYLNLVGWRKRLRGFWVKPGPCLKCENSPYPTDFFAQGISKIFMSFAMNNPNKILAELLSFIAGGRRPRYQK